MSKLALALFVLALGSASPACTQEVPVPGERFVIGMVGKSQSNPVFQAAHAGAKAAARELGARRGLEVVLEWRTPAHEDAEEQAQAVEQLARSGVRGIAISCSDANTCTEAIDKAVYLGSQVFCFDSDAPQSQRFAFFGTDDLACGKALMEELAKVMRERGTIAVLAGNQSAPNLQRRVQGVLDELANHPEMRLLPDGVFYCRETPEEAAQAVARAQSLHPEIQGWAMVGGWPLFTRGALPWPAGKVRVVAVDALPAQLDYLLSGHADVLLAQDCYGWGYKSVQYLLAKVLDGEDPPNGPILHDEIHQVTKAQAEACAAQWKQWITEAR